MNYINRWSYDIFSKQLDVVIEIRVQNIKVIDMFHLMPNVSTVGVVLMNIRILS